MTIDRIDVYHLMKVEAVTEGEVGTYTLRDTRLHTYNNRQDRCHERTLIGGSNLWLQKWTRDRDERYLREWLSFTSNTWVELVWTNNKRELEWNESEQRL